MMRLHKKFRTLITTPMTKLLGVKKKRKNTLIGRWRTTDDYHTRMRRSMLADIDSCGDEICSFPRKLIGTVYRDQNKTMRGGCTKK